MKRILAIKLRNIGDTVLWTAALRELKTLHSPCVIDVLVPKHCAAVLKGNPFIDKIYTPQSSSRLFLIKSLCSLRSNKYHAALGFHATTSLCKWIFILGAKVRVLHHHSWTKNPFWNTHKLPRPGQLEDAITRDFQVLNAVGIDSANHKTDLSYLVKDQPQPKRVPIKNVALLIGASISTKRYPLNQLSAFVQLCKAKHPDVKFSFLCDSKLSKELKLKDSAKKLGIAIIDDLALTDFMRKISEFDAVISNDSGPLHIAIALGLKSLSFFGPSCVADWHPYDKSQQLVLRKEISCRNKGPKDQDKFKFCTLETCEHLSCLKNISPYETLEEFEKLQQINRSPSSP